MGGEELCPDHSSKESVGAEVVPFHHIAGETGDDDAPFGCADFLVDELRSARDLGTDVIHAAQKLYARSRLREGRRIENVLEHAARVGKRDQRDVGGVWRLAVEQKLENAALAFQPFLALLHRISAFFENPQMDVVLPRQDSALAKFLERFAAQLDG